MFSLEKLHSENIQTMLETDKLRNKEKNVL